MAEYIRDEFEKKHGGKWQCTVGIDAGYGSSVYSKDYLFSFALGAYKILLFDYPN